MEPCRHPKEACILYPLIHASILGGTWFNDLLFCFLSPTTPVNILAFQVSNTGHLCISTTQSLSLLYLLLEAKLCQWLEVHWAGQLLCSLLLPRGLVTVPQPEMVHFWPTSGQ